MTSTEQEHETTTEQGIGTGRGATIIVTGPLFKCLVQNMDATRAPKKVRNGRPALGFAGVDIHAGAAEFWTTDTYQALRQEIEDETDHSGIVVSVTRRGTDEVLSIPMDVDALVAAVKVFEKNAAVTIEVQEDRDGWNVTVSDGNVTFPVGADAQLPKIQSIYWNAADACENHPGIDTMCLSADRLAQFGKLHATNEGDYRPMTFHCAEDELKPVVWSRPDHELPKMSGVVMPVKR